MPARYRNTGGGLTPAQNLQLAASMEALQRHRLDEDYQQAVKEHATLNCSWYRVGLGVVVRVPGHDPEERLRG